MHVICCSLNNCHIEPTYLSSFERISIQFYQFYHCHHLTFPNYAGFKVTQILVIIRRSIFLKVLVVYLQRLTCIIYCDNIYHTSSHSGLLQYYFSFFHKVNFWSPLVSFLYFFCKISVFLTISNL